MKRTLLIVAPLILVGLLGTAAVWLPGHGQERLAIQNGVRFVAGDPEKDVLKMFREGRQIFRFDTFGDEAFWGDALKLHQAIAGKQLGGVGNGVSPKTALGVGLRVDTEALP